VSSASRRCIPVILSALLFYFLGLEDNALRALRISSLSGRRAPAEEGYPGREGKSDDGNSRLVAMPRRGKRAGEVERRMPVSAVFENLESRASVEDIMEWFHLTRDLVVAILEFAARSLDAPVPVPASISSDAHPL
jgi:hypothetical protein